MSQKPLFRPAALNRLSSPEELDNLLRVTSPHGWIALAGIGLLLLAVLAWSVLGSVPTKLEGQQCILVRHGGVHSVATAASGRLSDLAVDVGDWVARGQTIGRLEQSELLQKIEAGEARLKEQQAQYERALAVAQQGAGLRAATHAAQERNLAHQLAAAQERLRLLKERIDTEKGLYEQGLITKQTLIASQLEAARVQLEADNIGAQGKQLHVAGLEARKQSGDEVAQARLQLDEARRALALLVRDAKNFAAIISPYAGRVLEVKAVEGQLVERGTALVSLESSGVDTNEIEAYVYLPASDGKKVHNGMKVEISPSTARREEFGFLSAFVSTVADYPSTDQGLMRVFGNDKLVRQLSGAQAPIQVKAALVPSSSSPSRYQWSTRAGPPFQIQSGTACSASITLSEQRPLALVLPILKQAAGLD